MRLAQVGAWGSATRTSSTSSFAGARSSTVGTSGPAGGCSPAIEGELFPVGSLPGAPRGSTGEAHWSLVSSFYRPLLSGIWRAE